jgi:hypothetical protein
MFVKPPVCTVKKPYYTGIPSYEENYEERIKCNRDLKYAWQKGYVPYIAILSNRQQENHRAFESILARYIRKKGGILWPDEFKEFSRMFFEKHPETKYGTGSRLIRDDMYTYSDRGCALSKWNFGGIRILKMFGWHADSLFHQNAPKKLPKQNKRTSALLIFAISQIQIETRGK